MLPFQNFLIAAVLSTSTIALSACDLPFLKDTNNDSQARLVKESNSSSGDIKTDIKRIDFDDANSALAAVYGASEIPYPVYPNGQKYRVGGENGLKIVVFQTDDAFDTVDEYYSQVKDNAGMARLLAMQDYVRYAKANADTDADPWATHKPGIVIHQFNDEVERKAVGASPSARTNIIMSF